MKSQEVVFFVGFWKERLSYQSCAHNASKRADRVAQKPMLFIRLRMELTLKLFLKVLAASMQNQKNDSGFIFKVRLNYNVKRDMNSLWTLKLS